MFEVGAFAGLKNPNSTVTGLPSEMWMRFTAPNSIITSLSDRLTTDIAVIQGTQVILNVSNANTITALQFAQAQVSNLVAT